MYLFNFFLQDNHGIGMKAFANSYFSQKNANRVDLLAGLMESMVEKNILQPRFLLFN